MHNFRSYVNNEWMCNMYTLYRHTGKSKGVKSVMLWWNSGATVM